MDWPEVSEPPDITRAMPDDQSEKIIKLLEEIRNLNQARNEKLETMAQASRERYEEGRKRYEEGLERLKATQARALGFRRRLLLVAMVLILICLGLIVYLAFWVIPKTESPTPEQWMRQMQSMETNDLARPR